MADLKKKGQFGRFREIDALFKRVDVVKRKEQEDFVEEFDESTAGKKVVIKGGMQNLLLGK